MTYCNINMPSVSRGSGYRVQPNNSTDEGDDVATSPPKGCIEVHWRMRELDLMTVYSDWTNWMHKILNIGATVNVVVFYQVDRGGLFRPANQLDVVEGSEGVGTTVDPREFYMWVQSSLMWVAVGAVLAMRNSGSLDSIRIALAVMVLAFLWLPIRMALELDFSLGRGDYGDPSLVEMNNFLVIQTPIFMILLFRYVWILYVVQSRVANGEDLPDLDVEDDDSSDVDASEETAVLENRLRLQGKREDIEAALAALPEEDRATIHDNIGA